MKAELRNTSANLQEPRGIRAAKRRITAHHRPSLCSSLLPLGDSWRRRRRRRRRCTAWLVKLSPHRTANTRNRLLMWSLSGEREVSKETCNLGSRVRGNPSDWRKKNTFRETRSLFSVFQTGKI